jgi:ornithine cyclodeaminase/alanine dehydrogenase-like protein (mu-crystallin family)
VGACTPVHRELDTAVCACHVIYVCSTLYHLLSVLAVLTMCTVCSMQAVRRSRVFVDTMAACLTEPGDLVAPLSCGDIEPSHLLGELGAVLAGTLAGRTSDDEITLFKSVGIALEDLTAAVAMQRRSCELS